MNKRFEIPELTTPSDLFDKIEDDLCELRRSSQNVRVAFNLFVSLEHLSDWLELRVLVRDNCVLRIISNIANGAKHLKISEKRHSSVTRLEKERWVEEGWVEDGWVDAPLTVFLSEKEAEELGVSYIDSVTLAERAIDFWRPHVESY